MPSVSWILSKKVSPKISSVILVHCILEQHYNFTVSKTGDVSGFTKQSTTSILTSTACYPDLDWCRILRDQPEKTLPEDAADFSGQYDQVNTAVRPWPPLKGANLFKWSEILRCLLYWRGRPCACPILQLRQLLLSLSSHFSLVIRTEQPKKLKRNFCTYYFGYS